MFARPVFHAVELPFEALAGGTTFLAILPYKLKYAVATGAVQPIIVRLLQRFVGPHVRRTVGIYLDLGTINPAFQFADITVLFRQPQGIGGLILIFQRRRLDAPFA